MLIDVTLSDRDRISGNSSTPANRNGFGCQERRAAELWVVRNCQCLGRQRAARQRERQIADVDFAAECRGRASLDQRPELIGVSQEGRKGHQHDESADNCGDVSKGMVGHGILPVADRRRRSSLCSYGCKHEAPDAGLGPLVLLRVFARDGSQSRIVGLVERLPEKCQQLSYGACRFRPRLGRSSRIRFRGVWSPFLTG